MEESICARARASPLPLGRVEGAIVRFRGSSSSSSSHPSNRGSFHVLQLLGAVVLPEHHLGLEPPGPMFYEPKPGRRVRVTIGPKDPARDDADQNHDDQNHYDDAWKGGVIR